MTASRLSGGSSGFIANFKKGHDEAYAERGSRPNDQSSLAGRPLIAALAAGTIIVLLASARSGPRVADPLPTPVRWLEAPPRRSEAAVRRILLAGDRHGHFHVVVSFSGPNGRRRWRCMIDSGASWLTITREQAAELGFDSNRLAFSDVMATANGTIRDAPITLPAIAIAERFSINNVAVEIDGGDLDECLLGMSVLRLMRVSFAGGAMELSW